MDRVKMLTRSRGSRGFRRLWFGAWLAGSIGATGGLSGATPSGIGLTPIPQREPPVVQAPGPRIQVDEPTHDFGRVPSGEGRTHEFLVKNVGTAPLEIRQVRTSCGCTTTGEWDRQIEPGSTGRIPLRFDTGSFSGTIQRTVTLVTNDPRQSQLVMQVKAEIWVPVEVRPRTVMFQYHSDTTEGETKEVRLISHLDEPLQFDEVRSDHPSFAVTLDTVDPGREYALQIRTVPPLGSGMITTPLVLKPSNPDVAPIQVIAYAIERQPITISPSRLLLPSGTRPTGARPSITIRNNTANALELSDPQLNVPEATVELTELQPNRLFRLTPVFPEGFTLTPGERVELTVKSNHPRHPEIRVPVVTSGPTVRTPTPQPVVAPRTNVVSRPVSRPASTPSPAPPPLPRVE